MTKRKMHTVRDSQGYTRYLTFEIGETIRWPKNGANMLKATVLADQENYWLVVDRCNKQHLAWKGCVQPL